MSHKIKIKPSSVRQHNRRIDPKLRFDFPKGLEGNKTHFSIYVPSTIEVDKPVSKEEFHRRVMEVVDYVRKTFGGSTRISGVGNYFSDKKSKPVTESIVKVEAFTTPESYNRHDQDLKSFLEKKKQEWSQEALSYEYNEELFFV